MERATLEKALELREREIEILRKISETIACTLDLDQVLGQIIDLVVEVTAADSCLLYLFDDCRKELVLRASKDPHPRIIGRIKLRLGEGITGWVARERRPVAIARGAYGDPRFKFFHDLPEDRYEAFLSVPVISKNQVIGVINIQHRCERQHSENEVALVSMIAQQVGGAIENARLYAQAEKRAKQIETIAEVSRTISSNGYTKATLDLIARLIAEVLGSAICSIVLVDCEKGELVIKAEHSAGPDYGLCSRLKTDQDLIGRVVKERRPLILPDVTAEPDCSYSQTARAYELRSFIAVPMTLEDRVVGVISSYGHEERNLTEDEIRMLSAVANQAAIALENLRLRSEARAVREALETRKLVERAKGILQRQDGLTEEQAHKLLQQQSMRLRRSLREIAQAIILASEIKAGDFNKPETIGSGRALR